jgi:hypothetical protein
MTMFRNNSGKVPNKDRKLAADKTKLTAQQVNKWIFDQRERERKKVFENLGINMDQTIVFTVTGKDDKCLQPIFKIERVPKTAIGRLDNQESNDWQSSLV